MNNSSIPSSQSVSQILSAIFLVAGTCIGGGMLALPVATGVSGFLPSIAAMLVCWLAMTASALLLLEVNLWMKEGAHVITMASTILGPIGKAVSWVVFLFISYASLVAYTAAGGSMVISALEPLLGMAPSKELGCFIFITVFGFIIYLGTSIVGRVNSILFIAMIASYFGLVSTGIGEVKGELLTHQRWTTSLLAIPFLLTSFSFQTMLPSLTPYLKRNASALRWAIVGGTTLTAIVYLLWQLVALGIVPVSGPSSLMTALEVGEPVTQFMRAHIKSQWLAYFVAYFAFFALVTSFLGIALGLFDFLADGFKIKKEKGGQILLGLLVSVPTFFFAVYLERIFIVALETSGGYGDSILNGIMPVLMVWIGRYYLRFPNENRTWGGKPLLVAVLCFFVFSLGLQFLMQSGYVCSVLDYCRMDLSTRDDVNIL